jgi:hypothetical protein
MICKHCKKKNDISSKFCTRCGKPLNTNATPQYHINPHACRICGRSIPTKYVEFYQNIGILFVRQSSYVKGNLCKRCINQQFGRKTLITLFLGWWGVISFCINWFYLANNILRFIPTIGMKVE